MIRNNSIFRIINIIIVFVILFLAAFPILPYGGRSVSLIILILLSFFKMYIIKGLKVKTEKNIFFLLIVTLPYILLTLTLFYSSDIQYGVKRLVKMLGFVLLPIVFYINKDIVSQKVTERALITFLVSVLVLILFQLTKCLNEIEFLVASPNEIELKSLNLNNSALMNERRINQIKLRRFRKFIVSVSNTHMTYQGMWIVFAMGIILRFLKKSKGILQKITLITFGLLMFGWLFLISTRISIVAFIIGVFSLLFIIKGRSLKPKNVLLFFTGIMFVLSFMYILFPGFKLRINEVLQTKMELPTSGRDIYNFNSTNVRYGIYYCSFNVIQENFIFGTGIGDMQSELNECFDNRIGAKIFTWKDYNSHNQYLFFFISSGLVGVSIFLVSVIFSLYISFQRRNILHFYFIIIVMIFFLTENVLSRSDGVIFYSLFNSMYLFNSRSIKK